MKTQPPSPREKKAIETFEALIKEQGEAQARVKLYQAMTAPRGAFR